MEMKENQFNSVRERTPLLVVAYALPFTFGPARRVSQLSLLGVRRSHEGKEGTGLGRMSEIMAVKSKGVAVVDETVVNFAVRFTGVALDPK